MPTSIMLLKKSIMSLRWL